MTEMTTEAQNNNTFLVYQYQLDGKHTVWMLMQNFWYTDFGQNIPDYRFLGVQFCQRAGKHLPMRQPTVPGFWPSVPKCSDSNPNDYVCILPNTGVEADDVT